MQSLPRPARYFPLESGRYELVPGLKALGTDYGNGEVDRKIFQIDTDFEKFRESKLAGRRERLSKYYVEKDLSPEVRKAAFFKIKDLLCQEYPQYFTERFGKLSCALTKEVIAFDTDGNLCEESVYTSGLDALTSQVQEDIAITSYEPAKGNWLSFLHVSSPGHWSPEEKIGKNFVSVHGNIPGIEKVNAAADGLVQGSIKKGPYTRFVWGFATDRRLNHHPEPPPGISKDDWWGRKFSLAQDPPFLLRVERQVILGLPEVNASLFFIRPYYLDGNEIKNNQRERALLLGGLTSMNSGHLEYKGLTEALPAVLEWLQK